MKIKINSQSVVIFSLALTLVSTLLLFTFNLKTKKNVLGASTNSDTSNLFNYCVDENSWEILVNKINPIDANYVPNDLVSLDKIGANNYGSQKMRMAAARALVLMQRDLKRDLGVDIYVTSGFRDFKTQQNLRNFWRKILGKASDYRSADAGKSEHQLGTAMDISLKSKVPIYPYGSPSSAWKWLSQYAYKYGFVQSYSVANSHVSGYDFEPWHWRYIGVEMATKIHNSGLSPEKFYIPKGCW